MLRVQSHGLAWYTFAGPGSRLQTACLTRLGGVSRPPFAALNLGHTVGDSPDAVKENTRRMLEAFSLTPDFVVSPHQVHGKQVASVSGSDGGTVIPATDALLTDTPGLALLLRFADCVPVLFYDPVHHAAGLAHAGWRGAAAGVIPETVRAMQRVFDSRPSDLWAGIGPAIGPERYAVGPEVVEAIAATLPADVQVARQQAGQWYLDLPGAVAAQLATLGLQQVEPSGLYTASHTDEWYSHRAEGGRTGRFGVLVRLA